MDDFWDAPPIEKKTRPVGHYRRHPLDLATPKRIHEFLMQDRFWVDASLNKLRIKDMDSDYLFSTMLHLLGRAPQLFLVLDLSTGGGSTDCPHARIQSMPLFLKFRERYEKLTNPEF